MRCKHGHRRKRGSGVPVSLWQSPCRNLSEHVLFAEGLRAGMARLSVKEMKACCRPWCSVPSAPWTAPSFFHTGEAPFFWGWRSAFSRGSNKAGRKPGFLFLCTIKRSKQEERAFILQLCLVSSLNYGQMGSDSLWPLKGHRKSTWDL